MGAAGTRTGGLGAAVAEKGAAEGGPIFTGTAARTKGTRKNYHSF
jgi:hypothetical protein